MNKTITESSAGDAPISYDIYNDGSADIICPSCKQKRALVGKAADSFIKYFKTSPDYKCVTCYQGGGETKGDDRQEQISWGQSWNLAVALMEKGVPTEDDGRDELYKREIEKWQKYF